MARKHHFLSFHAPRQPTSRPAGAAVRGVFGLLIALFALAGAPLADAATAANAQSPLGTNLNGIAFFTSEQPFLNVFKTTAVSRTSIGWTTSSPTVGDTGEEQYLQLDADGYPTTLTASSADPHAQQFQWVYLVLLFNLPNSNHGTGLPYRAGQYVVLYDGQGTMSYGLDAQLVSSAPGRDVINVQTPHSNSGISLAIKATDPNHTGNYIRNIRVVKAEEEALLAAGNVFSPNFLSLIQHFRALRFMDWLSTNNSNLTSWSNRPLPSNGGYGSANGAPLEVAVQLCNAVSADCWLNIPHKADNDYITRMAQLVHASLGTGQKVYVELSNEVWNGSFQQSAYATAQGKTLWPGAKATDYDYNRSWYGMRVAQTCDIWKSTWGSDANRVVCVMGAQAAGAYSATQALDCPLWTGTGNAPCSKHGIDAVAIAPYFGFFTMPTTWLSDPDGGLAKLFQQLFSGGVLAGGYAGGDIKQTSDWEAAYRTALAPYKLPFIAYEAGQSFQGFPKYLDGSAMVNSYIAANRDPRMGQAYTTALNNWKANGGQLYMNFQDICTASKYGEWGALESFMDPVSPLTSAPPKWQALQNFIAANPCWWGGCSSSTISNGSTAEVPMAPSNLSIH